MRLHEERRSAGADCECESIPDASGQDCCSGCRRKTGRERDPRRGHEIEDFLKRVFDENSVRVFSRALVGASAFRLRDEPLQK